jgi:hypothetical protein
MTIASDGGWKTRASAVVPVSMRESLVALGRLMGAEG